MSDGDNDFEVEPGEMEAQILDQHTQAQGTEPVNDESNGSDYTRTSQSHGEGKDLRN